MEIKVQLPMAPPANAGSAVSPLAAEGTVRAAPKSETAGQGVEQPRTRESEQKHLQLLVEQIQRKVQVSAPNLHFSVDRDTGRTVIRVTDANTKEVIRQIPAEEILRLDKELDRMQGLLLNKQG